MSKILSVIIPMYNVEAYIYQCLESFRVISLLEEIEVLIIDDGSTDNSAVIARQFCTAYPKSYRLISKTNGGHGSAINTGIQNASGTYLKVVDGDDWVDSNALQSLLSYLRTFCGDLVCTPYSWVESQTKRKKQDRNQFPDRIQWKKIYPFESVCDHVFVKMHNMTIRTDLLKKYLKPLDEHCFYVDNEFILYPIPYIQTISFLPDSLYMYRIGRAEQSINICKMRERCTEHEYVLYQLLHFYNECCEKNTISTLHYIEYGIARMACSQIKIYLSFPYSMDARRRLISFEHMLQKEYPNIYNRMKHFAVQLLRVSRYHLYPLGSYMLRLIYKVS